jgi:EAL domain-containing protein (putative c-di-GMP-specific phosphodiesterase class I)
LCLGIEIIAEGIETEGQKEFLLSAGCEHGQASTLAGRLMPRAPLRCCTQARLRRHGGRFGCCSPRRRKADFP